jgi:homogentisate 1,2-dioxygenase
MRYHTLGELPAKRHIQFRRNGTLLTEEVMGYEGFSGNQSILYHLKSPCRVRGVGELERLTVDEWIPDSYVHRHMKTAPVERAQDPIRGRRLLMWNDDVHIALCKPTCESEAFYRNGFGDECLFIAEGTGTIESIFGQIPFREHDYVVIPRGTTYRIRLDEGPQTWLCFFTPGELEVPSRYMNRYGQLLEDAPYWHRDFHPPQELDTHDERGEFELIVRVAAGYQHLILDYHPFDVVGWDGYVYPYTFNANDFEPRTGRIQLPPPSHQTFQGPNFVICSFCPRALDYDERAVPVPYNHSNLQSEEVIYYVTGEFISRKGIEVGSITLHPSGLPHGPQPGLAEKALGAKWTDELAVMCDTFRPLRLTGLTQGLDDPAYALSWYDEPAELVEAAT